MTAVSYTVSGIRARLLYNIALLHGLDATAPLQVASASRSAGGLAQSVTGLGTVTLETLTLPILQGDVQGWIDALAAVHGLTTDLTVSDSQRLAGAISQTISTTDGVTTVARV